jgi:LCP family protein required for cell wall assembly
LDRNDRYNNGNGNGKRKKKSLAGLFFKTFFITFFVAVTLVFAGWLTLQATGKPPFIYEAINKLTQNAEPAKKITEAENDDEEDAAFFTPEPEHEDTLIGGGVHMPEGFTHNDRKDDFYTFLIFGIDDGNNTDTIMVAAYDGIAKKGYVIGIPRDTKVNVKRNIKRINAAYAAGNSNGGGREGGVDQLKREMKTIIGFTPDYYVCVNIKAFKRIIDTVGGVDVVARVSMVYDDIYQDLHINISKGEHHLNGEEALKFARYRQGNKDANGKIINEIGDYGRIENQQQVIKSVLSKLLTPANLLKIPEFISIFNDNVFTDISLTQMSWFALKLNDVRNSDALETFTLPTDGFEPRPWYELPDEAGIVELVNQTINPYMKDIEAKNLDIAKKGS